MEHPSPPTPTPADGRKEPPLARYFMMKGGQRHGPLTPRQMVDLGLTGGHAVWREGLAGWTRAADVPELAKLSSKLPPAAPSPPVEQPAAAAEPIKPSRAAVYASSAVRLGGEVFGSFRKLDLRREVWPLDAAAARTLAGDPAFWWVTLLAALPLVFYTLSTQEQTLTAFSLFFAGVWGLIYCYVVQGERVGWGWRVGCFLFTGLIGLNGLLLVYPILPAWYVSLPESAGLAGRFVGFIAQVGLLEEAAKAVPVAILAIALRRRLNQADVVLLGLFSGLGFAAFENLSYFHNQLTSNVTGAVDAVVAVGNQTVTGDAALTRLASGAYATMLLPLARSLASPFSHAAWAGIVAHFIGVAVRPDAKGRRVALIACGLGIAATLHGLYDAFFSIQPILPAVVAVVSFMLLRIYLASAAPEVTLAPAMQESVVVQPAEITHV